MSEDKPFFLEFKKKEQLTNDTFTFFFERNGTEKPFVSGQYYEIKLPHKNMDERGDSRVFTISSSPTNKEHITITTRIIKSSFKLHLLRLKSGTKVQFSGPWDDLNFDEKDTSPHVFLAGGIGITPYHSIVQYCIDMNIKTQITLFASWKNIDEMIFNEFFRNAEKELTNLDYIPTVTDKESLKKTKWTGENGRVDRDMIFKYVNEIKTSKYFISGPQAMVGALKKTVQEMGVPNDKIIAEEFEGY